MYQKSAVANVRSRLHENGIIELYAMLHLFGCVRIAYGFILFLCLYLFRMFCADRGHK